MANVLDYNIIVNLTPVALLGSLSGYIPLEKHELLCTLLQIKSHHCCSSTRMALALNYSQTLICHYKKKPNQTMVRVFTNGPGDLASIPGRVIPKTKKNGT